MKVRAPSADSRYFEVHEAHPRAAACTRSARRPAARTSPSAGGAARRRSRSSATPAPARAATATSTPGGPSSRPTRSSRCASRSGQADGAEARRRHVGRPRRPARPRGRPLRGHDPGAQGASCPGASVEVLTPDFLGVEEEALAIVLGAAARGLQPQHRDRPTAASAGCAAPRHLRQGALAARPREGDRRLPGADEVGDHRRARRDERRGRRDDARPARARRRRRHDRPVPPALRQACADRPLGAPRRVPHVPRGGRARWASARSSRARSSARRTGDEQRTRPRRPRASRRPSAQAASSRSV